MAFFHPDLGIGGAERLVVDAALALQQRGCHVVLYTAHHEPERCFRETSDGTLHVEVVGDWYASLRAVSRLHLLAAEPAHGAGSGSRGTCWAADTPSLPTCA